MISQISRITAEFVVLALGGWATLWMAVLADMGTGLGVGAQGLRHSENKAWPGRC